MTTTVTSSIANFFFDTSGQPLVIPNATNASGSLLVSYEFENLPASSQISIEGIIDAIGATVLDTYTDNVSVSNWSVALNGVQYDRWRIVATWSGGTEVIINGSLSAQGSGPEFSPADLSAIQTYSA